MTTSMDDEPSDLPCAERAADGHDLADVIRGVIGHEQDGSHVRLLTRLPVGTSAVRSFTSCADQFSSFSRDAAYNTRPSAQACGARRRRDPPASNHPAISGCARSWR